MHDLKTTELRNCSFVKTILMLLIILGHSIAFWSGGWIEWEPVFSSSPLRLFYFWLLSFHIYTFAFVSGYIFAFKRSGGGYGSYLPFLRNKAKRLLVPYLFVALVWVIPISELCFHWDVDTLLKKYVLCIGPSQLWFLWMLFLVFAMAWPLYRIFAEKKALGALIALGFYAVGILGRKFLPNVFCIWSACEYMFVFYLGIRFRLADPKKEKLFAVVYKIPWWAWLCAGIAFYAVSAALPEKGAFFKALGLGVDFLLHAFGAVAAFMTLQKLANAVAWGEWKWFGLLKKNAMPMYLFHQQIIYFTIYWLNGVVNPYVNAAVNFAVAAAGALLISMLLMRFRPTRFLIGEK